MTPLFPPIVPGLTESAEGKPEMQTLYQIAMYYHGNKKKAGEMLNRIYKLFSPKEPEPDPLETGIQPPGSSQVTLPPYGQLSGRPFGP